MQDAYRKNATTTGMENMNFDLWVDGQQLPQQMRMKSNQTSEGTLTMTMKYRDYGKPVDITEPPADQVTDFAEMMKQLGGGLGGA